VSWWRANAEERTDEDADEKSDETAEEDSEAEGSTADEAEESRTASDSDSDEADSSEESANADASDTQEAKGSEAQEDDQKGAAGKRTTLASVSDVERLEAQAEFLTEQIKSLDGSVDRFFTRVQKRVTFFKDQAVARSRRSCVPDKEKLSTFEFDITNAMNATFKDWSVVLRAFDAFGKQLRNLEGFESSDRASFEEQAAALPLVASASCAWSLRRRPCASAAGRGAGAGSAGSCRWRGDKRCHAAG